MMAMPLLCVLPLRRDEEEETFTARHAQAQRPITVAAMKATRRQSKPPSLSRMFSTSSSCLSCSESTLRPSLREALRLRGCSGGGGEEERGGEGSGADAGSAGGSGEIGAAGGGGGGSGGRGGEVGGGYGAGEGGGEGGVGGEGGSEGGL